ncbi:helix-hairpin-helix domain-containing protein [Crocosphaera sp.]|uniref:helix-hairpin-helix domain-containing protein n=1 Tax=Crocosphaera sp. TaxID=2729996 RepID=UPI00262B8B1B|nr:helix-hairpin-helix domain-containing protein [Crocosphaera sp.]MDJ0578443.1 helix-hairpin-helix domain-containing protein [Crocosphaera sp.]
MKLSTSLVSVKRINSSVERSQFNEKEIEKSAQAILDAEGIINPIILEKISLESYEVVCGYFEYYAAVRAREIDPRKGEMISAFIIEEKKEEAIKTQIKIFRESNQNSSNKTIVTGGSEQKLSNMESRLTNIEARFERQLTEVQNKYKNEIETLNKELTEIKQRLPEPIDCLKALNTLSLPMLVSHLSRGGINKSILEKLISEREKNGDFTSCSDVVSRVKGLGDKTMIKIIDQFSD